MLLYNTTKKEKVEVNITKTSGEYSGPCPSCDSSRKHHGTKSFSFNVDKGTGKCFNCEDTFVIHREMEREYQKTEYFRPLKFVNNTELSDAMVKYFESRKISKKTIIEMRITEKMEWMPQTNKEMNCICFNYFRNDELINTKFRDGKKHFKLVQKAELIPYNLDGLKGQDCAIWCEGEFDQLSYFEAGYKFAVSVPNGAQKVNQNLVYIDNAINELDGIKTHYISSDNDEPGRALRDELIRRFGSENCKLIELDECKDANEFLIKKGKFALKEKVTNAKEIPLSGIYDLENDKEGLYDLWRNGMPGGFEIGYQKVNKLITWVCGALAIWTGIPSSGKSEMVDDICEQLNILHGWKVGYFSPENWPTKLHVSKIVSRISGKKYSITSLPEKELDTTLDYVKNNFFFINPDNEDLSVESILAHAKALIKRKGIKILVIDPWNKLDHKMENGESETKYISRVLDVLDIFAKKNDILIHLVAHPTKMKKDAAGQLEVPNLYDISGSAHFYNKAFYGFSVHRIDDIVLLNVLKVKFKHLGESRGGTVELRYNINNGRYVEAEELPENQVWHNDSHLLIKPEAIITPAKTIQPNIDFYGKDNDKDVNKIPF
jgi:twinkle protein